MKKLLKSLAFLAVAAVAQSAFAGAQWLGNSYISANGTWYQAHGTEGWATGGAFDGHDFGNVTTIDLGGQLQIGDNGNNWGGGAGDWMNYSIDGGAAQHINLAYNNYGYGEYNNNMLFQSGGTGWATTAIDVSGLAPGPHTIAVSFGPVDGVYENNQSSETLYTATFSTGTKTVTFHANGDDVILPLESMESPVGGVYMVGGIPSPTRPNFRFRGWFTDPDAGERIRGYMDVLDADPLDLYAHWERARQTVTFNANGEGAVPGKASAKYYQGETYTSLTSATWENHIFLGWFTEDDEPVVKGDVVSSEYERTLFAHWEAAQTVTFVGNAEGAICPRPSKVFAHGANYSGFGTPTCPGRKFLGWFADDEDGARVQTGMAVTVADTRTLYAHWTEARQTVYFIGNEGTPSKPSKTCLFGGNYSGLASATRDGFKFLGWYADDEDGVRVSNGMPVTEAVSRNLYAHWEELVAPAAVASAATASKAAKAARGIDVTDTITAGILAATNTTYMEFSGVDKTKDGINSDAVYAGKNSKNSNGAMQLRISDKSSGIVTTTSGGKAKAVTVVWQTTPASDSGLEVYGKSSAYTMAGNLYTNDTMGTLIGTITNGTTFEISGDYAFIGLKSKKGTIYPSSIAIGWQTSASEPTVKVTAEATKVAVNALVEITAEAEGFSGDVTWTWTGSGISDTNTFVFSAAVADVYTVTATATDGTSTKSASVDITVCEPHAINVTAGEHGDAEATPATAIEGTTVNVTWLAEDGYTLDTITVNNGAVTVTGTSFEMPDADANVVVTFKETDEFEQITDIDDLKAGEYVIAWGTTAMKAAVNTGSTKFLLTNEVALTIEGSSVFDPADAIVWTLAQVDNGWTIYNEAVGYAYYSGSGNSAASEAEYTDKSTWTIAESGEDDGLFKVQNVGTTNRYLQYNSGTPRFACYTDSQKNLAFYKKKVAAQTKIVTFHANGDNVDMPIETLECTVGEVYKVGGIPSATRPNFRFRGWFTDPDAGERIRGYMEVLDADPLDLYAHWERARQTVTFNANGEGAVPGKASAKYYQGETYTSLTSATWENHIFLGWFTEDDEPVVKGDVVSSEYERTLYAHWEAAQTVTFVGNAEGAICPRQSRMYAHGSNYSGFGTPTCPGRKFLGWFADDEDGARVETGMAVTVADTRTLYAHWTEARQTLYFFGNEGTPSKPSRTCLFGGNYSGLASATREGYRFLGWYADDEDGARVSNGMPVTEDITRNLYAHWKEGSSAPAVTGFAMSSRSAAPAARGAADSTIECTLWTLTSANGVYEVQWTDALGGEWTALKHWIADEDAEVSVTVEVPASYASGFFRVVEVDAE